MKKILYITHYSSPGMIKLAGKIKKYFETEFWFYDRDGVVRPEWWKIPFTKECRIIKPVFFKKWARYFAPILIKMLKEYKPDIMLLGGFFVPSNYLAYRWGKRNGVKTIVFTETFRKNGILRKKSIFSLLVEYLYKDLDAVFCCHEQATEQMKSVFPSLGKKACTAYYAADIDSYFDHPIREKRKDNDYVYLFPNRLINIYNPLLAVEIFADIVRRYPESRLRINSEGELKSKVVSLIRELKIENSVEFLDDIKSWDELPLVYRDSDILLFPAKFSNGNFTISESMASGMGIVISNKIRGNTKWLNNGESGYICNPNKEEFLKAIQEYIDYPAKFKTHAEINRKIVWPQSVEAVSKMHAKLIEKYVV